MGGTLSMHEVNVKFEQNVSIKTWRKETTRET
jgi:hypothetical protein